MFNTLTNLWWALGIDTTPVDIFTQFYEFFATGWAVFRHRKLWAAVLSVWVYYTDNLRDDFAGFFDYYPIPNANISTMNFILIMQRGALDGRSGQFYRFKFGNGGYFPEPTD